MPPQLREIGFHVENHSTQWHGFRHEIQLQEVVVAWIQLTLKFKVRPPNALLTHTHTNTHTDTLRVSSVAASPY